MTLCCFLFSYGQMILTIGIPVHIGIMPHINIGFLLVFMAQIIWLTASALHKILRHLKVLIFAGNLSHFH